LKVKILIITIIIKYKIKQYFNIISHTSYRKLNKTHKANYIKDDK